MILTIQQAAAQLGLTTRQVRYMIQLGKLRARKAQGRWIIDSEDLPRSLGQRAAEARKARQLRGLVEGALEMPEDLPRRYSVLDLKAFQLCLPLYRRASEQLGEEHAATAQLRRGGVYRQPLAVKVLGLDAAPLPPEAGLPIGSYLSQWAGSLYLDGLDHFIKRTLKINAYLRFMDDLTIFGDDAAELWEARGAIADWLCCERRLELNPKRGAVRPAEQPSVYLGYRVSRGGIVPSRKMKRRMKKRLRAVRQQGRARLERSLRSYRGLMTFG